MKRRQFMQGAGVAPVIMLVDGKLLLADSAAAGNPLLEIQFPVPFDKIKASHVDPAVETAIAAAVRERERICSLEGERTYANTMERFDRLTELPTYVASVAMHLNSVADTPELREAVQTIMPKLAAFESSLYLHAPSWQAYQEYASTTEAKKLTGPRQRFVTRQMAEFRRNGADLDAAGKKRLEEIDVELAKLGRKFADNSLDATNAFELIVEDEAKLAGLPERAKEAARRSAEEKGKSGWRFTLQYPSVEPVLRYLDDAAIREKIYRAYRSRASGGEYDNGPVIVQVLALRQEKAKLLGYADYADYKTALRMAKSGGRAADFLADLAGKTKPAAEREAEELQRFRREIEGAGAPELQAWDVEYYAEKLRHARYDFNEEDLRPYFPLDGVMRGMFEIVRRLYGIRVEPASGVPAWDPAVNYYRVLDSEGTLLGCFYADWFPRENKRAGAWANDLIVGGPNTGGGFDPHLGLICGNLTKPSGDKPSLLSHYEVQTVFHEFGHVLHVMLSRSPVRSLAGTSVAWDFVELPSQIMENWCWEREALDLFARHHETGQPIPEELFQKMTAARTFRAASAQMRQLAFGSTDMALHREFSAAKDGDVVAYSRRVMQRFEPVPLPDDFAVVTSFTHLFAGGYAAGYYSYKWAEVLDADAFSRFKKEGILSRKVGGEFWSKILAKGGSEDESVMFRDFMGRDPDPKALLERLGLV